MLGNIYFLFYTIGQISSWSKPRSKLLAFIEKHEKAELEMKCKKKNLFIVTFFCSTTVSLEVYLASVYLCF